MLATTKPIVPRKKKHHRRLASTLPTLEVKSLDDSVNKIFDSSFKQRPQLAPTRAPSTTQPMLTRLPITTKRSVISSHGRFRLALKSSRPKKFLIQPFAYHGTMMLEHLTSETYQSAGGWQSSGTICPGSRASSSMIEKADFIWFKHEDVDTIPEVPRSTLPRAILKDTELLECMNARILNQEVTRKKIPHWDICANLERTAQATKPFTSRPLDGAKPLQYSSMVLPQGFRVISCFKRLSGLWRKHLLYRNLKLWCDQDPENRGSIRDRMPYTLLLDLNDESALECCLEAAKELSNRATTWLAKPTGGANGKGIRFQKDLQGLIRTVISEVKPTGKLERDWWVIQEYIDRMPLVNGARFHMKIQSLLIATPIGLDLYSYRKQRLQTCQVPYDGEKFLANPLMCITNWAQQKKKRGRSSAKYLVNLEEVVTNHASEAASVWDSANGIIADAVEAVFLHDFDHLSFTVGCFELLGCDFVVEEIQTEEGSAVWKPLLLEINHRPGYTCSKSFIEQYIRDAVDLALSPIQSSKHQVEERWQHVRTLIIPPTSSCSEPVE